MKAVKCKNGNLSFISRDETRLFNKIDFEKFISNLQDDASFLESSISTYKLQKSDGNEIKIPEYFDSWKECVVAAQELSVELINTTDDINQYRLATKYICKEVYVQGA